MTLTYEITPRFLPDRYTAVMRAEVPMAGLPAWLAHTFRAVREYLGRSGVPPIGPPFARYTMLGDIVAVEAGYPIPREVPGDGAVEPSRLPSGPAATVTHVGQCDDPTPAYTAILGWLDTIRYAPTGPHWEVYYTDPVVEPDPTHWRTVVVVPYRTAGA